MSQYLDFEKEQKGYKLLSKNKETLKSNIGKKVCYVTRVDPHRGYMTVGYGVICCVRYSQLYLDDYQTQVDIRDIKEMGIKIEEETT